MPDHAIIADRAEFVDALRQLRKGHVLVKSASDSSCACVLDGEVVVHAYEPLVHYGLIDSFDPARWDEGRRSD